MLVTRVAPWYTVPMEKRLDSPKELLARCNRNPNRALGQNFLTDEAVIAAIVEGAEIENRPVLEVGPGLGALTRPLCDRASRVVAVEKDAAMATLLGEGLSAKNLTICNQDFLHYDCAAAFPGEAWCAVGNLPYYVTTPIAERLLLAGPDSITVMVQQEAAERFTAQPGDRVYGPMAVVSQCCYAPQILLQVPRSCFWPQPEVDSTVVRLLKKSGKQFGGNSADLNVEQFYRFLKQAFAMRRKTLKNNLGKLPGFDRAMEALNFDPGVRGEALTPEQLAQLMIQMNLRNPQEDRDHV